MTVQQRRGQSENEKRVEMRGDGNITIENGCEIIP